jgi:hypothetical protein
MTPAQKGAATTAVLASLALVVAAVNPFGGPFGPNGGSVGGSSFSGTAATFTSTQTDGGAAFVAPTSQKVCLNGSTCTQYVQSDGGSIGLVGAPVEAPQNATTPRLSITPVSSLGTCNGTTVPEGSLKLLAAASVAGPSRLCMCISDGIGPTYLWVNTGCQLTPGDATTCPECLSP